MENRRILVVDDDISQLNEIEEILKSRGWLVDTVSDPADGLICNSYRDYDLIITDLVMPNITGDEFIEIVLTKVCNSKFIIITSFGYDPSHSLVKLNCDYEIPIFIKPINSDNFIAKIDEIFSQNSPINSICYSNEVENVV
jgi:DNA-binding NtrC family response regulator